MKRRLAITKDGKLSMCSCPEAKMGRGRCKHVGVYEGESGNEIKAEGTGKKFKEFSKRADKFEELWEKDLTEEDRLNIAQNSSDLETLILLAENDEGKVEEAARARATDLGYYGEKYEDKVEDIINNAFK